MRAGLKIKLPSKGLSFNFYRDLLAKVRSEVGEDLARVSHDAWANEAGDGPLPKPPDLPSPTDQDFWLVGAYWDSEDAPDQTNRFLEEGIWENGYEDRYLDLVRSMKVGDKIAIKSTTTQKHELPFDSRGHTVSLMLIKATGTIVSNPGDGRRVEVEWDDPQPAPRSWYFYTLRSTVWRIRKEDHYAQQLIRFVFGGDEQDYEYFTTRWWGDPGKGEVPPPIDITAEPYSAADLQAEGVFLSEDEVEVLLRRLRTKKNLILRGAPGVGKTFVAKRLAFALMEAKDEARLTMVQFHPSYSYEDFVRGYRPTPHAGQFELVDGPFWYICKAAEADPDHKYVLVIDEINRSNVSQVLGELMMLLEADKRAKHYEVRPLYRRSDDEKLFIPPNLYLIGTMNIADRSLALVDYALRRRFAYFTLEPRFGDAAYREWLAGRGMAPELCNLIIERMTALNHFIAGDRRLGAAYRVGHSFFCPSGINFSPLDERWYREIIQTEIDPLLEEYWYDDPASLEQARKLL
ncbi:MAG: AAA family ATPase [Bryobacteraceae bacterium]|nr:AAA family ATPase [Bryobacteraceae bacterium]